MTDVALRSAERVAVCLAGGDARAAWRELAVCALSTAPDLPADGRALSTAPEEAP